MNVYGRDQIWWLLSVLYSCCSCCSTLRLSLSYNSTRWHELSSGKCSSWWIWLNFSFFNFLFEQTAYGENKMISIFLICFETTLEKGYRLTLLYICYFTSAKQLLPSTELTWLYRQVFDDGKVSILHLMKDMMCTFHYP